MSHRMIPLLATAAALTFAGGVAHAQTSFGQVLFATPTTPWSGPYAGLHGGYATDGELIEDTPTPSNILATRNYVRPPAIFETRTGFIGGGQIGWNVQHGQFFGGLEADASITDMQDKTTFYSPETFGTALKGRRSDTSSRTNYLTSARARFGLAEGPVLIYGTGGFAHAQAHDRAIFASGAQTYIYDYAHEKTYDLNGWVAGGGIEYMLPRRVVGHHLTVRAEYLHYELGDRSLPVISNGIPLGGYTLSEHHGADTFRAAVNFKF